MKFAQNNDQQEKSGGVGNRQPSFEKKNVNLEIFPKVFGVKMKHMCHRHT